MNADNPHLLSVESALVNPPKGAPTKPAGLEFAGAELFSALAVAQGQMSNPIFDSTNPHYKTRYASLAAVRNAIIPALSENGLALIQDVYTTAASVIITTRLLHTSGQSMTFTPLEMPVTKADAQGYGAAETYGRRYALLGVACVAGERDTDAEPSADERPEPQATASATTKATKAQVSLLKKKFDAIDGGMTAFLRDNNLGSLEDVSFDGVNAALEWIAKHKATA